MPAPLSQLVTTQSALRTTPLIAHVQQGVCMSNSDSLAVHTWSRPRCCNNHQLRGCPGKWAFITAAAFSGWRNFNTFAPCKDSISGAPTSCAAAVIDTGRWPYAKLCRTKVAVPCGYAIEQSQASYAKHFAPIVSAAGLKLLHAWKQIGVQMVIDV